jgi:hypothetical protein
MFPSFTFSRPAPQLSGEVIMIFGRGRLIRRRDGRFELQGGTWADYTAAKEYASLFLHSASPVKTPAAS